MGENREHPRQHPVMRVRVCPYVYSEDCRDRSDPNDIGKTNAGEVL